MRVPLLNFEGGPAVPLLMFEGVPGPGPQDPEVPGPGVLVPLLHHAAFLHAFLKLQFFLFPFLMQDGCRYRWNFNDESLFTYRYLFGFQEG